MDPSYRCTEGRTEGRTKSAAAPSPPAKVGAAPGGHARTGVLLVNLGTPDAPTPAAVRRYLKEFLGDPRVIDLPGPLRWLLLRAVILPFRPRRSAHAYAQIFTERGSPLRLYTDALAAKLQRALGESHVVAVGMRYGSPLLRDALGALRAAALSRIVVVPLFPQYASASTGTALEAVYAIAGESLTVPHLAIVPPYFDHPAFIEAVAAVARPLLAASDPDHVVMSYHGLPERQIRASDPTGSHCLMRGDCCERIAAANAMCYRAQCVATSRALAHALDLDPDRYTIAFQSRLGRAAWIGPATDKIIPELAANGHRRLAVICPSFVSDCLETLEEIGLRARDQWRGTGGTDFTLIPCVNDHPTWVQGVAALVKATESRDCIVA
jgi:ferrochelatase